MLGKGNYTYDYQSKGYYNYRKSKGKGKGDTPKGPPLPTGQCYNQRKRRKTIRHCVLLLRKTRTHIRQVLVERT
eukprot:1734469-Amphidinium_carterae.1